MKVNVAEGLYSYNARLLVGLLLFTWDLEDEPILNSFFSPTARQGAATTLMPRSIACILSRERTGTCPTQRARDGLGDPDVHRAGTPITPMTSLRAPRPAD